MQTTDHWQDIDKLYTILSMDWFANCLIYHKAKLVRLYTDTTDSDGYSHTANTIQIISPLIEIDLPDTFGALQSLSDSIDPTDINKSEDSTLDNSAPPAWQEWKSALVHEVLHEYEKKVIKIVSDTGRALHAHYINNNFDYPERHAEAYYTAIADRAEYFSLSPQELRERIQVRGSHCSRAPRTFHPSPA